MSSRAKVLTIAFETNGKGYLGFIAELPGAFVRGRDESEAISKVEREASSYYHWFTGTTYSGPYKVRVAEVHKSTVSVEDADSAILLQVDRKSLTRDEYADLRDIGHRSGRSFVELYSQAKLKDWVDPARERKTFHGDNPKTIREIFEHVKEAQGYYLSRFGLSRSPSGDFMEIRHAMLEGLGRLSAGGDASAVYEVDGELWTIRKAIRRLVWHERIHGKAIVRMLEKQRQLKLIDDYLDPFFFEVRTPGRPTL